MKTAAGTHAAKRRPFFLPFVYVGRLFCVLCNIYKKYSLILLNISSIKGEFLHRFKKNSAY